MYLFILIESFALLEYLCKPYGLDLMIILSIVVVLLFLFIFYDSSFFIIKSIIFTMNYYLLIGKLSRKFEIALKRHECAVGL